MDGNRRRKLLKDDQEVLVDVRYDVDDSTVFRISHARALDCFCGRTPHSILARHYTDYSPAKLKQIYDKANLIVLQQAIG